jgi:molybdopterin converting factor subunit 1
VPPIKVLYFASLKQLTGVASEVIPLAEDPTVADLLATIERSHPAVRASLPTVVVAVNREFAERSRRLQAGDDVALFPPVSGGSTGPTVLLLTEEELDIDSLLAALTLPTTGAACVFSGMVRQETRGDSPRQTLHLEYEAYPEMAREKMAQIADEIRVRWPAIEGIGLVQRLGRLLPGTSTVLIACTAAHRDTGVFEAARYGIDRLKQIVPVWKKEVGPNSESWVEGSHMPSADDRAG